MTDSLSPSATAIEAAVKAALKVDELPLKMWNKETLTRVLKAAIKTAYAADEGLAALRAEVERLRDGSDLCHPTYSELVRQRDAAEQRVAELERQLARAGVVTGNDAEVIAKEIQDGTPDTPERIETMRRADEAFQRSGMGSRRSEDRNRTDLAISAREPATLAAKMRHAVDVELPEDEPNDVREWVYEACAKVALVELGAAVREREQLQRESNEKTQRYADAAESWAEELAEVRSERDAARRALDRAVSWAEIHAALNAYQQPQTGPEESAMGAALSGFLKARAALGAPREGT